MAARHTGSDAAMGAVAPAASGAGPGDAGPGTP